MSRILLQVVNSSLLVYSGTTVHTALLVVRPINKAGMLGAGLYVSLLSLQGKEFHTGTMKRGLNRKDGLNEGEKIECMRCMGSLKPIC